MNTSFSTKKFGRKHFTVKKAAIRREKQVQRAAADRHGRSTGARMQPGEGWDRGALGSSTKGGPDSTFTRHHSLDFNVVAPCSKTSPHVSRVMKIFSKELGGLRGDVQQLRWRAQAARGRGRATGGV
jgi:hypothetical protein